MIKKTIVTVFSNNIYQIQERNNNQAIAKEMNYSKQYNNSFKKDKT